MESERHSAKRWEIRFRVILLAATLFLTVCVLSVPVWFHLFSTPATDAGDHYISSAPTISDDPASSIQQAVPVSPDGTTEPTEPKVMLPEMAELYAKNPEVAAWIKIEDTDIDYPVMHTPYDEEKYIYLNFEEKYDWNGLPFINDNCSFDPETKSILIYGHNKIYGGMFHDLLRYAKKEYWQEHRYITFKTLYEERTYEVFAAFYDKVYLPEENVFKYYHFIDPQTEDAFQEGIDYFCEKTPYETDVEVMYNDRILMLITCSYKQKHGRYVVVAREVSADPAADME